MATPTKSPTWADGGSGVVTDPGTSKQALGFANAEAPAAGHHNWVLQGHGEWIEHMREAMMAQLVRASLLFTGETQSVGIGFGSNMYYLPGEDKWYVFTDNSGDVDLHESADGITWGSATNYIWSCNNVPSNFIETGGSVYTAAGDVGIASSAGAASAFTPETNTFANLTLVHRVMYDATNAVWIAMGSATGAGDIETSTAMGGTWTQRKTVAAAPMVGVANNGAGITVAIDDANSSFYYSSNGTTWTTDASPTWVPDHVVWNEQMQLFVFFAYGQDDFAVTTDGTDYTEYNTSTNGNLQNIINTPQGIAIFPQSGAAGVPTQVQFLRGASDVDRPLNFVLEDFFNVASSSAFYDLIISVATAGAGIHECGNNTLAWRNSEVGAGNWNSAKY